MEHHSAKKEALRQDFMQAGRRDNEYYGMAVERASHKCEYCGQPFRELHHIIPVSMGGASKLKNLVALCTKCHRRAHGGWKDSDIKLNEEMKQYFQALNEDRTPRTKTEIIRFIIDRKNTAFSYKEHGASKKAIFFYSGKYQAYEEILDLLSELEE